MMTDGQRIITIPRHDPVNRVHHGWHRSGRGVDGPKVQAAAVMEPVIPCGAMCPVISGIESRLGARNDGQCHWRSAVHAGATQNTRRLTWDGADGA